MTWQAAAIVLPVAAFLGYLSHWLLPSPARRIAERLETFFDDWNGEPARPGVKERPGVMERLDKIETTLNNGLAASVAAAASNAKEAAEQATRANQLAGEAAARSATAVQLAEDASRAVNALRAEVDVYTNVVLEDRTKLHRKLRELGADLSDLD